MRSGVVNIARNKNRISIIRMKRNKKKSHKNFMLKYPQVAHDLKGYSSVEEMIKCGELTQISLYLFADILIIYEAYPEYFPQFKDIVSDFNKNVKGEFI